MDGQDPNQANRGGQDGGPANNEFVNFGAVGANNGQDDGQQPPGLAQGGVVGGGAGGDGDDENADYFDDGGETFLPADHVSYSND